MKSSIQIQKNLLFASIIFIALGYILILWNVFQILLNACISKLILITGVISDLETIQYVWKDMLIFIALSMFFVFAILRIIHAVFKNIIKIYATNYYINKLKIYSENDINYIVSQDNRAFTHGFFAPQIYISKNLEKLISKEEYKAVLLHELAHKSYFDPIRVIIVEMIFDAIILPFGRAINSKYKLLTELVADNYAIEKLSSKKVVVNVLYKMLIETKFINTNFASASERVNILTGESSYKLLLSVLLMFFISTAFLASGVKGSEISILDHCADVENCLVDNYINENQFINQRSCFEVKVGKNYSPVFQSKGF